MKNRSPSKKERIRRGIYILPNLFTTMNLFCGFYAVIASINNNFLMAAIAIIIAGVFDLLDGKIARATRTTSKFGVEYDSLADLVSFGLAPGLLIYLWALRPLGRIGWLAAFLFMVCGALRLARFNAQVGRVSSDFFTGLPIPAAAGMCTATVLLFYKLNLAVDAHRMLILIMLYVLGFLMVSNIRYRSFKKAGLFSRTNFNYLVAAILVLIFIAAQPSITLFIIGLMYVSSGPISAVLRIAIVRRRQPDTSEIEEHRTIP